MDKRQDPVRAAVLLIGDELLCGQTRDANLAWIARRLESRGVRVAEARIVADETDAIVAALNRLRNRHDWVLATGGIGPTHDDITADAVAQAFGVGISRNHEAVRRLQEHYAGSEHELNESRLRMARIPEGARLIDNPVSAAPGFLIGNVAVMAGVPEIMRAMLEHVLELLPEGAAPLRRGVRVFAGEGDLAAPLRELQAAWQEVRIGCYPSFRDGRPAGVRIVLRCRDAEALQAAFAGLLERLRSLGAQPETLEENGAEHADVAER